MSDPIGPDDPLFDGVPVALFPVRLETRFFPGTNRAFELRVRIYPDALLAETFEARLTNAEVRLAQQFVEDAWRAGPDVSRQRDAFVRLCDRVGGPRAAWLAQSMAPTNPSDAPTTSLAPDAVLAPSPAWPDGVRRDPTEFVAPTVALLPDRWYAIAYKYAVASPGSAPRLERVGVGTSEAVQSGLRLAPGFDDAAVGDGQTAPRMDPNLRWLVDFDAAHAAGMAVRIDLDDDSLDRVIVVGVRTTDDANLGADAVTAWLAHQQYARGVACLAPGTPTRHTGAGTDPSHMHDALFAAERRGPTFQPGDNAGTELAHALGISPAFFQNVAGTDATTLPARDMVTALWPATWGYYLEQMMHPADPNTPGPLDAIARAAVRAHAIAYLRPGGALPALRIGDLAYGVLPATAVRRFTGGTPTERGLAKLLASAQDLWLPAVARVPRLRASERTEAELLDVLRHAPQTVAFAAANVRGPAFFNLLQSLFGAFLFPGWLAQRGQLSDRVLKKLGVTYQPKLAQTTSEAETDAGFVPVTSALVAAVLSETDALAGSANYVDWLLRADYASVRDEKFDGPVPFTGDPATLLYKLMRHSILLGYANAAQTMPGIGMFQEIEALFPFFGQPAQETLDTLIGASIPSLQQTLRDALGATGGLGGDAFRELRDALLRLRDRPTAELDRLSAETLDAASHRIDAWFSSLANARLAAARTLRPTGLRVGAYGWVDGVTRTDAAAGSGGYLLAPSLAHATTGAVLRSGQLAHDAELDLMHFDLSPARVRTALQLLGGVRAGQALPALLGYVAERALHKQELDRFIAPLRALCPLVAGRDAATTGPVEHIAEANVVDGVALHRLLVAGPLAGPSLPVATSPEGLALTGALAVLDEAYAAVADVLICESVHHLVRGDAARATGALDPIAAGESIPGDLSFLAAPRTGTGLVHRVAVGLDTPLPAGWALVGAAAARQVRAGAEPRLNAWVGALLGDPGRVHCTFTETGGPGGDISFADLGLSPLDVLALSSATDGAELSRHVAACAVAAGLATRGAAVTLQLDGGRDPVWPTGALELAAFLACARRVRDMVAAARPLDARDLLPNGAPAVASGVAAAELEHRADTAAAALAALATPPDEAAARTEWLWRAAAFGVGDAVPLPDDAYPIVRAGRVADVLAGRRAALAAVAVAPLADLDARVAAARATLGAVFGPDFVAVPTFAPANAAAVSAGFAVDAGGPLEVMTWLQRTARVRVGCGRLWRSLAVCESLGGVRLVLSACQLAGGSTWIGLPKPITGPGTSLVMVGSAVTPTCGLLVEQWTEVMPAARETAAVAFHYEAPPNRAPQAILIAAPPDLTRKWTYTDLEIVISETLDLAQLRAVDQAALFAPGDDPQAPNLNQYLPAIYLANNPLNETVSTRFGRLF